MKKEKYFFFFTVITVLFLTSFNVFSQQINKAICVISPTKGNTVNGIVTFTKTGNGIKVVADINDLKPGEHGFHIHQYGDCSADNGTSAGGHFNPENMNHAGPMSKMRHAGDMGNITADTNGIVHLEWTDDLLSFEGEKSIIGRGMIIHAGKDDFTTQPTGDAGSRVGCGVIGITK